MKRLKARISAIGLAVASGAVAGAALLPATPASAMVVINDPAPSVRVGHTFTVGDWFQQWSGGSRWFTTNVYSPTGTRIFHEAGYAPNTHWDFWSIRATRPGTYRVRYEIRLHNGRDDYGWFNVRSHR